MCIRDRLLGGIVTQYLGWRWNFFINVPIGILVIAFAWKLVPRHENEEKKSNLDLPGAVSVTVGLMSLVYALTNAPTKGWTSHSSLLFFGIAIVLLVFFVMNELRAKHPLMPMSIFKIRNVAGANLIQLTVAASLFSVFFFTTLYVQEILGYSPVKTGVSFLALPIVIAICATNAPHLIKRIGFRPILIAVSYTHLLSNKNATEPFSAILPPCFEKTKRIFGYVLFILSVAASAIMATPPGP